MILFPNVKFISVSTKGILTYIFSVFFVYYYVFKFRIDSVLSLNNVNIFTGNRFTYFHQEKAISGSGIRFFLIRSNLSYQARVKSGVIVVQSQRIKSRLIDELAIDAKRIIVRWPGVRSVRTEKQCDAKEELQNYLPWTFFEDIQSKKLAILPIYDAFSAHKDYEFFHRLHPILVKKGYIVISLCPKNSGVGDYSVGLVPKSIIDELYAISDLMILISKEETLCLPLFEFVQTGKPILARKAPYLDDFRVRYSKWLNNVIPIEPSASQACVERAIDSVSSVPISDASMSMLNNGNWDFIGEKG